MKYFWYQVLEMYSEYYVSPIIAHIRYCFGGMDLAFLNWNIFNLTLYIINCKKKKKTPKILSLTIVKCNVIISEKYLLLVEIRSVKSDSRKKKKVHLKGSRIPFHVYTSGKRHESSLDNTRQLYIWIRTETLRCQNSQQKTSAKSFPFYTNAIKLVVR